jgi:hypothetical protein
MPALVMLIAALLLPAGPWAAQAPAKAFPKKSGIYAMTPQGPVELKISGERNDVEKAIGLKSFYSAESFDQIPAAESVQSFYVSAMGWQAQGLYLVVGREALTNSLDKYQRLAGRVVMRGAVAYEVQSVDLASTAFVRGAIQRLAPAGAADASIEAYLVLELASTTGLNARTYPIRIQVPRD